MSDDAALQQPSQITALWDRFRPCFSARGCDTFIALVTGLIAAPARRTVCAMLIASGASGIWHHSRAHRFFASIRWNPTTSGSS